MSIGKKTTFLILSFAAILLTVYHKWFLSFGILSYGDWRYFFSEYHLNLFRDSFSTWRDAIGYGSVALDLGQSPTFFLYGLFGRLFSPDFALTERIVHFWPAVIIAPIASAILLRKLFANSLAVFVGVLYYSFNTYFLVGQTGHLTLMVAFAIAPLVIYLYIRTVEERTLTLAIGTALCFAGLAMYEPRASYIVFGVLLLYLLYYFFFLNTGYTKRFMLRLFGYALLPFLLFGLLNIYWIYPLANVGVISSNELFSRVLYGGNLFTITYSFTLFHPFWTGSTLKIATTQPIIFYFWLYPILAILGLLLNRTNKYVLFFGGIAVLGIFLSKQSDVPFISFYQWLYDHFPGFNAFREASKFYFLVAIGQAVLIAAFFQWLWQRDWTNQRYRVGAYVVTVVVITVLLWTTKPLITGEMETLFFTREVPDEFMRVKDYILKQHAYFRTLWIPTNSRWSYYSSQNPQLIMIDMVHGKWEPFIGRDPDRSDTADIATLLNTDEFAYILDNSATKYVIVSSRNLNNEEDWIGSADNRIRYIQALDNLTYLKKLNIGTEELTVYENPRVKPHIYLTDEREQVTKAVPYTQVNYSFVSPTEYTVRLKANRPFYLNFSENFHPDWRVRIGTFDRFATLTSRDYFLPQKNHIQNEPGLNGYYIDLKTACGEFTCRKNTDGSYSMDITLYFMPQTYLYLGMFVSGVTLLLCLGALLYYGSKKAKTS